MMDLKKILMELGNHLVNECGFASALPSGTWPVRMAKEHLEDTAVLALVSEWLNRVPEAQEYLVRQGLSWPVVVISAPPKADAKPIDSDVQHSKVIDSDEPQPDVDLNQEYIIRAFNEANVYQEYFLCGQIGQMLRLEQINQRYSIRAVKIDSIHPEDRGRVRKILSKLSEQAVRKLQQGLRDSIPELKDQQEP
jgi:hypothetical protein